MWQVLTNEVKIWKGWFVWRQLCWFASSWQNTCGKIFGSFPNFPKTDSTLSINLKNGVNTAALAGVIEKTLAEAASAALLSVVWQQQIGPLTNGKQDWIQNVNAYWASNSRQQCAACRSIPNSNMRTLVPRWFGIETNQLGDLERRPQYQPNFEMPSHETGALTMCEQGVVVIVRVNGVLTKRCAQAARA